MTRTRVSPVTPLRRADRIDSPTGASATVEQRDGAEAVCVRDARGALLFEYRPEEGRSVVYAPDGDLSLRAEGRIDLDAEEVRVRGRRELTLESERAVSAAVTDEHGRATSRLAILRRAASLWSPLLQIRSAGAHVHVDEARLEADEVHETVGRLHRTVELLDTTAGRILERAKEAYRETEGLTQTKAGRMRLVAEKTLHALGDRTLLKARKDMKLRGDKIYLC